MVLWVEKDTKTGHGKASGEYGMGNVCGHDSIRLRGHGLHGTGTREHRVIQVTSRSLTT
jgi:hypothetical protein